MNKKLLLIPIVLVGVAIVVFNIVNKKSSGGASVQNSNSTATTTYSLADVSQHNSETNCWMTIDNNVYNVTSYISQHPNSQILDGCGKDATNMFNRVMKHQGRATSMLSSYLVGSLK